MSELIANQVIRFRWFLLVLCVALIGVAAMGGSKIAFTSDYRVFFDEGNEQLEAYEKLQASYEKSDNVLFVLKPKNQQDVFNKQTLQAVQWLTKEAWQTPFSTRVDSISNYQHTRAEEDDLIVADLVSEDLTLNRNEILYIKQVSLSDPLLVHRLISESGHVTAVNVTVKLPGIELDENEKVAGFSREIKAQLQQKYPELDVYMSGFIMLNEAFQTSSQKDMSTLVPLMFLVVLVTLGILLRSISATVATLIVIVASILTAMGLTGWLGIKLTPPSASAPTIILTMAVADTVHVLVAFLQNYHAGSSKIEAMRESIRVNLQPIFLTSVTTIIGFLSMNFSEVPPFHDLGNIVSMGVAAAFVYSITLLPAIVLALPIKQKLKQQKSDSSEHQSMQGMANFVINNRKRLLWGMSLFTIATVAFLPKNELNDEWVQYFDKSTEFRSDTDFILENLTGLYTLEFSLDAGEDGSVSDPQFLRVVEEFTQVANAQPEVIHVNTFTDIMKRLNKNMHGDDQTFYKLPKERNLAAQYLLLYEMSLPYGLDLNNQINVSKTSTRVIVTAKNLSTKATIALEEKLGAWLVVNGMGYEFYAASPSLMFAHIGERNVVSMLGGTAVALILISILLIFALKSFRIGVVSLIPNMIPALIAFGIWGIFVSQIGMSLAIVAGMTLGIVVDDSVHFLSKYLRARREKGLDPTEAVRYAFAHVGKALVVTTIVLAAGFSVLTFSTFSMNSDMGVLTAITIVIALVTDFLLLPAILITYEKENKNVQVTNQLATDSVG
ncbi:MAG: MMPL family transporter [Kangiellaceae bacterium]|nr:MMPL family transporter [Kangiellaceae bacterium]